MPTHRPPKKPVPQDWHNADIVAALWKRGTSLRKLARVHGLSPTALTVSLQRSWPRAQRIIAEAIGVAPQEIWPSRYEPDGTPKKGPHLKLRSPARPASNASSAATPTLTESVGNDPAPGNGNVARRVRQEEAA